MSYTTEQLTEYNQLKREVRFFELQRNKKGWLYAFGLCFAFACMIKLLGLLKALLREEAFTSWLQRQQWGELLFHMAFGSVLLYLGITQRIYHRLINKKRAMHNLLLEHPDLEKPAS